MIRTHVLFDGLQDPAHARALSQRLTAAGYANTVDPTGQSGWIAAEDGHPLTEEETLNAVAITRAFGIELRDRAGRQFRAENDLDNLRHQTAREYRARLAQGLVFGLPALLVHYFGPVLAGAGASEPGGMLYPWLIEGVLVGWACLVAGWPILWQAGLSLIHLRPTGDLLTASLVLLSFIPSAVGVIALAFTDTPWMPADGPFFHATLALVVLATAQRWWIYRLAPRLAGRADLLPRGISRILLGWLMLAVAVLVLTGNWPLALAVGLLMPPMAGLGTVNGLTPGITTLLPIIAWTGFWLIAPASLVPSTAEIEIAAGFQLVMLVVFWLGWRQLPERPPSEPA
ncbi:MAG: hypothetical protein R3336_04430 [Phycisphaeraceae bacterium]|nr:hypothetical protein [Phycisphaeraceae bacterium]